MTPSLFTPRIEPPVTEMSVNPFMDEVHEYDHKFWDKLIEDFV